MHGQAEDALGNQYYGFPGRFGLFMAKKDEYAIIPQGERKGGDEMDGRVNELS